jgi:adenosylmethionine-8-amino-7-oxononanoate aminotransferase
LHTVVNLDRAHVWHPFTQEQTAPAPIEIIAAKGSRLVGANGREFLDLISSWWVTLHGHAHPRIAQAIAEQARTLEQVIFAGFTHAPAVQLAAELGRHLPAGLERVFFSDDGSTSVEVALKMALQFWGNQGEAKRRFLAFDGGYHGDTVGAMSAGRGSGFFDAFKAMLFSVDLLPYPATWQGDDQVDEKEATALLALEKYLERYGHETAALIIEPLVQGASGMRMCRPSFLQALSSRLKQANVLLIFDEVMTGFGRTGELFACQRAKVTPDIICLSKGLTGGFLPLAVTVCHNTIYQAFLGETFDRAFTHGHSFTANPLGCAAALASLQVFDEEHTLAKVSRIETIHRDSLTRLRLSPKLRRLRLTGTIAAMDIVADKEGYTSPIAAKLKNHFHAQGLLLRPLGNVLYLLPPYCINEAELKQAYDIIEHAMANVV